VVTGDDLNQLREKISKQEEQIKHLQQSVEEQRLSLE
jgi:cell division protein FtsL